MLNMKFKIAFIFLNIAFNVNGYAQGNQSTPIAPADISTKSTLAAVESEKNKPTKIPKFVPNKVYDIKTEELLKNALEREKYDDFYNIIINTPISKDRYIKYLESVQGEGHIPLYWLMAEYYASESDVLNTMRWLYTALILTEQDANICNNNSNAPAYMLSMHPKAEEIARKNPQKNTIILKEIYVFIQNLKVRSHPKWACIYGKDNIGTRDITLPQERWGEERKKILLKYEDMFNLKNLNKDVFGQPFKK